MFVCVFACLFVCGGLLLLVGFWCSVACLCVFCVSVCACPCPAFVFGLAPPLGCLGVPGTPPSSSPGLGGRASGERGLHV